MLNLWRKSIELFRKFPILWVPYIAAMVIGSCLSWLGRFETKRIVEWLATRQTESVLGGNFSRSTFDFPTIQTAMRVRAALRWGSAYLEVCVDTVALVLTAMMVAAILHDQRPALPAAAAKLRGYPMRILIYSLKAWLLLVVLFVVLYWPFYLPLPSMPLGHLANSALSKGLSLLNSLCFASVMAPLAITLLRPAGPPALSGEDKRLGRYFFLLTVAVTHVLGYFIYPLVQRLFIASANIEAVAHDFASLLTEFPYVMLYIALALIAAADPLETRNDGAPWTRKLLGALMPLHFGQGDGS